MRRNRITGKPPPTPTPAPEPSMAVAPAEDRAAFLVARTLKARWWSRVVSTVLNWPWLVILVGVAIIRWHRLLPPVSHAYALAGLAGSVTIAGLGAPLLNMVRPEEAWEGFLNTRVMRRSVFRSGNLDERYLDHPAVRKMMADHIRSNNAPAEETQQKVVKNSRRALLFAILSLGVLPWVPARNHTVTWLALAVPLAFAAKSLMEQWSIALVRLMGTWGDPLFAATVPSRPVPADQSSVVKGKSSLFS